MSNGMTLITRALASTVPEIHTLTMKYEDGGKTEVWSTSTKFVRVKAGANEMEIQAAFAEIPDA